MTQYISLHDAYKMLGIRTSKCPSYVHEEKKTAAIKKTIECKFCGKVIEKKNKQHLYCAKCNGINSRKNAKDKREGKKCIEEHKTSP